MIINFISMRACLMTAMVSLLLSGCALGPHRPAPVSSVNSSKSSAYNGAERGSYHGSYYTVNKGDTLYFISYVTDKDVQELAVYNGLKAPYVIHPGQRLKLWGPKYVAPAYGEEGRLIASSSPAVSSSSTPSRTVKYVPAPASKTVDKPAPTPASKPAVATSHVKSPSAQQESIKKVEKSKPKEYVNSNKVLTSEAKSSVVTPKPVPKTKPIAIAKPAQEVKPVPKPRPKPIKQQSDKVDSWLWPTKGRVIAKFSTGDQGNKGIDIAGQRGQDIIATAKGTVVYAGNALRGYGNLIIIKHNDDYLSAYAHNEALFVKEGQNVTAGQKIASMGSSSSSSVRLHFEIRLRGKSVNPQRYLP